MSNKEIHPHNTGRTYINAEEATELAYWSDKFNVSPNTLREAVYTVGSGLAAIKNYLRKVRGMAV